MALFSRFSILLCSLVLAVCFGELVCRSMFQREITLIRDPDHRLDPKIIEHNSDGIRSAKEAKDFPEDDINVVFLGDSFVYGLGHYPELAIPQRFERLARSRYQNCKINVANFGWSSSSPYLSLRLLRDIGHKYSPDVVFLALDMSDFHDDLMYRYLIEKPNLVAKGLDYLPGTIVLVKKSLDRLRRFQMAHTLHNYLFRMPVDRFYMVNNPLSETESLNAGMLESIDAIATFSESELKAKFVLLILPRAFQFSKKETPITRYEDSYTPLGPYTLEPFALFEKQRRYPVYSLLEDFKGALDRFPLFIYDDPHYSNNGLALVAEKTLDFAHQQRLFACPPQSPPQSSEPLSNFN